MDLSLIPRIAGLIVLATAMRGRRRVFSSGRATIRADVERLRTQAKAPARPM